MSYVSPAFAREHCNSVQVTELSDALLQFYINSAEKRAANFINRPLSEVLDDLAPPDTGDPLGGDDVRHAICYFVADAVMQRETIVIGTISSELRTAENLLFPYRVGLGV